MDMVLRTLATGAPGVLLGEDPQAIAHLEGFVASWEPERDPQGWLVAERAGALIGWARMDPIRPGCYSLVDLYVVPGPKREARGKWMLAALVARFAGQRLEAATWHRHSDPFLHALLSASLREGQFKIYVEKLYVRRDLQDYQSPYPPTFALRSLAELGEAAFIEALGPALRGGLARDLQAERPDLEFEEMRAMEGRTHNPEAWSVAFYGGLPAGVILPNRFAGAGEEGTFTFLGLAGPWRRLGLGPALHARGLELLVGMGARRYLCSTDVQNTPMLRLYARHGCTPFDIRRQYLWVPGTSAV